MPVPCRRVGLSFAALACVVYVTVYFVTRGQAALAHPSLIGVAGLFDLTITVPLLYWLVFVRRGGGSWSTAAMVSLAGARAAALILPTDQLRLPFQWFGVPVELWVISRIIRRMRRVDRGTDTLTGIRSAARTLFRNSTVANIVAAEICVLYYALFSWRTQPEARPGARAFAYAEASGWSMFPVIIGAALIFEGVPSHLVLARWSNMAAWIWTALDMYALLWVIAAARAAHLRPIFVTADKVLLRSGFFWDIEVPRDCIASCRRTSEPRPRRTPHFLSLTVMNDPQWVIELSQPISAHNFYGRRRNVTRIACAVDDNADFSAAITSTPSPS